MEQDLLWFIIILHIQQMFKELKKFVFSNVNRIAERLFRSLSSPS
jgi:hypothetical protein